MSDATNGGSTDDGTAQNGAGAATGDPAGQSHTDGTAAAGEGQQGSTEGTPDETGRTFDYDYVKGLRDESQGYRTQLREQQSAAEALRASLWSTKLAALGRLADPSDLPMPDDADPTDDDAIAAAVDALLERKPHLAARRARGDIGQHDTSDADEGSFSLLGTMQAHA